MSRVPESEGSWTRFVDPERSAATPAATPEATSEPERSPPHEPVRPLRRAVRRTFLLVLLLTVAGTWAWLDRAAGTEARIATVIEHGPPERASSWTRAHVALRGPPRIGLQIGHAHADRHPDELARLRTSTGAEDGDLLEVDVNRAVAEATAERLAAAGVRVDLLPATVPPGYRADLLVALHADASSDRARRGVKAAHPVPARTAREPWALRTLLAVYAAASDLPDDDANVTRAMLGYYAFSPHRYRHAAARSTPGVIFEMGYLTNPLDRAWITDPAGPAEALSDGIVRYLTAIDRWHPELAVEPPPTVTRIPPP